MIEDKRLRCWLSSAFGSTTIMHLDKFTSSATGAPHLHLAGSMALSSRAVVESSSDVVWFTPNIRRSAVSTHSSAERITELDSEPLSERQRKIRHPDLCRP
jgi:hypothetical protein